MRYRTTRFIKKNIAGWMFTLPLTLGLLVFTVWPMIQSLIYSFHNYNGLRVFKPIGLGNYIRMFTTDTEFFQVMKNTFVYSAVSVPLMLVLSYFVAVLVNQRLPGIRGFRILYYMPVVIPGVVGGVLWLELMNNRATGAFNTILGWFGLPPFSFLSSPDTAMASLFIMGLWGVGGGMVLWIAALKNIPETLYESAKIDGASTWSRLTRITIPMSTPMIFYNLIMGVIGSLQINSTLIFASRGGRGPEDSIYFIGVKIFNTAFMGSDPQLGYASAMAWVLLVIIGLLTLLLFRTSGWVFYGEEM
jgi:multiple sugar transport system permease protein